MDGARWNGGGGGSCFGGDEMEERRSIRESGGIRQAKRYGSTARHVTRNETLVKHPVAKSDTLQGIALRYGVTVGVVLS